MRIHFYAEAIQVPFVYHLPVLFRDIHEATIHRWLANEGEVVRQDDALVEVETAEAIIQLPAPVDGVLLTRGAAEGETIAVGATLAVFDVVERSASEILADAPPDVAHLLAAAVTMLETFDVPSLKRSLRVIAALRDPPVV